MDTRHLELRRCDNGFRIQRITRRQAVRPSHELTDEFFVDLALNDDASRIHTNLALMKERAKHRGAHGSVAAVGVSMNPDGVDTWQLLVHHKMLNLKAFATAFVAIFRQW
jgi:hypothetical protein